MTLFEKKILPEKRLLKAWEAIHSNNPQHPEIKNYKANLDRNIVDLRRELKSRTFQFQNYRAHLLHQSGKKKPRPLRVPPVKDRIVQKAIANAIQSKFRRLNLPCSHGYIQGRSPQTAIHQIVQLRDRGYWHVYEADIQSFFDKVDHSLLLPLITSILEPDLSLFPLIKAALECQIGNPEDFSSEELVEYFSDGTIGVPQGGILSPLLANAFLSSFDSAMISSGFKLVRYADDFVILCKTSGEIENVRKVTQEVLGDLKLFLNLSKSRPTDFTQGFEFLGVQFNGKTLTCSGKAMDKFKQNIKNRTDVKKSPDFVQSLLSIRRVIDGWARSYGFCHAENMKVKNDHMLRLFDHLDSFVRDQIGKYLKTCDFVPVKKHFEGIHYKRLNLPVMKSFLDRVETLDVLIDRMRKRGKNKRAVPAGNRS